MNPADHFLDLVTVGDQEKTKGKELNLQKMNIPIDLDFGLDKDDFTIKSVNPWLFQFYILVCRNWKEKLRRWDVYLMNVLITITVAIFMGCGTWYHIGNAIDSINPAPKRNNILFFCVIHQGVVSSLQGTYAFPLERALMLRERASGAYYVSAYFLAKTVVDMLVQLTLPVFFTIFVYPLCGLSTAGPTTGGKFMIFMAFNMLLQVSCTSLSNMMSTLMVSIEMSVVTLACALELTRLYSGFFVSPLALSQGGNDVGPYYNWKFMDSLSYMKWSYVGLCLNEYIDNEFVCPPWAKMPGTNTSQAYIPWKNAGAITLGIKCYNEVHHPISATPPYVLGIKGERIMEKFGYEEYTIDYCAGILVVYIVGCR